MVALILALLQPAVAAQRDLPVASEVDPAKYAGTWYEIALIPHWFERGCSETTARYTIRPDGRIDVVNTCQRDGKPHQAKAVAWHNGPGQDGKFKVRFFWPFSGHYWVIALDSRYQWAMVGHPSRKYLWILSRKPTLDAAIYDRLLQQATQLGYSPQSIKRTPQKS